MKLFNLYKNMKIIAMKDTNGGRYMHLHEWIHIAALLAVLSLISFILSTTGTDNKFSTFIAQLAGF